MIVSGGLKKVCITLYREYVYHGLNYNYTSLKFSTIKLSI